MPMELTASMVRSFKQCPRRYQLEYVYRLKPSLTPEALETGTRYHQKVEAILRREPWDRGGVTGAMAEAFDRYIPWEKWDVAGVEEEFRVRVSHGLYLKGKMDAVLADGSPVEHKSFGGTDWDKYAAHLAWDDQATLYLLATGARRLIYTVVKKPTIRKKADETDAEYAERCGDWYAPPKGSEHARTFYVLRKPEEIEAARGELKELAKLIRKRFFFRNPQACALVPCPYQSACLYWKPEIAHLFVGYEQKERVNEELCKF